MKIAGLFLFLAAGSLGLCQSTEKPAAPALPFKQFTMPPGAMIPWSFDLKGFTWAPERREPANPLLTIPASQTANARVDPGIVIHPPPSSVGTLAPGTPVAQNLYPKLMLLPIELGLIAPLSTQWPAFKLEDIPTAWPKLKMVAAQSNAPALQQTLPPK